MTVTRDGNTLTADLHGMQEADAKKALERLISSADKTITEIEVVHGHLGGQVLMNMVQKKLKHKRIERKILSLNRGMTSLLIKEG